jgi:hypothetical protein
MTYVTEISHNHNLSMILWLGLILHGAVPGHNV